MLTNREVAHIAHEANRALQGIQSAAGIPHRRAWFELPPDEQDTVIRGVEHRRTTGASPREMHENWCRDKTNDGWIFGPVKDSEAKTHPCLVDYDKLPPEQQLKDRLFSGIVDALSV